MEGTPIGCVKIYLNENACAFPSFCRQSTSQAEPLPRSCVQLTQRGFYFDVVKVKAASKNGNRRDKVMSDKKIAEPIK